MSRTRLYVECPNCHTHYLIKKGALSHSNGAHIENVAGAPEWQRLLCPRRPGNPYKFKLSETRRLKVFSDDESEHTHFSTQKNSTSGSGKADEMQ
jgi:hypothetical protein